MMDIAAATNAPPVSTAPNTSGLSPADEAAVFDKMVQGVLGTGLSLMNSVVGDVIDSVSEPFGDPDQ